MSSGAGSGSAPVPSTTVTTRADIELASAPMFQSLARKATATARPVKISGVARVSVSSSANCEPAAPLTTQGEGTETARRRAKHQQARR